MLNLHRDKISQGENRGKGRSLTYHIQDGKVAVDGRGTLAR